MNTQLVIIVHIINQVNNVSHGSEGKEYDIDLETYLHIYSTGYKLNTFFFFFFEFKAHVRSACTCRLQYTAVVIYVILTAVQARDLLLCALQTW